jgi:hypothetical protein
MITISNEFASTGRNFGNKLFTYAFAKSLADIYGYQLNIPDNSYIQRCGMVEKFPFDSSSGISIQQPEHYISDRCIHDRKLDKIIKEIEGHNTLLDGYFLKYEYIKPFKNQIKKLYAGLTESQNENNDCIILLRDSNSDGTFKLPDSYYTELLAGISFDKLYISYDHLEKHQSLLNKLIKFKPVLLDLKILDLFKVITTKRTLIACQGTFSFWAAFLTNADSIYWPKTNIGPNCESWCVNLNIDDDSRITFIDINI